MTKGYVFLGGVSLLVLGAFFALFGLRTSSPEPTIPIGRVCTMEAKICPDGSTVGRTGPNCEFAECPASIETLPATSPAPESSSTTGESTSGAIETQPLSQ